MRKMHGKIKKILLKHLFFFKRPNFDKLKKLHSVNNQAEDTRTHM